MRGFDNCLDVPQLYMIALDGVYTVGKPGNAGGERRLEDVWALATRGAGKALAVPLLSRSRWQDPI